MRLLDGVTCAIKAQNMDLPRVLVLLVCIDWCQARNYAWPPKLHRMVPGTKLCMVLFALVLDIFDGHVESNANGDNDTAIKCDR